MTQQNQNPIVIYLAETGDDVKALAARVGCSEESIYKYVNGTRKPRRKMCKPLSDAMGCMFSPLHLERYFHGGAHADR